MFVVVEADVMMVRCKPGVSMFKEDSGVDSALDFIGIHLYKRLSRVNE